jgi:tetratricopeptide (TPR) repeat protein
MKKIAICIIALAALAGFGWVGRLAYRSWKQEHLLKQARYYESKSDISNALLCLQRALQSNPSNVEAARMLADLAEVTHSPAAVIWRRRVTDLKPAVAQYRLEWAKTALTLGDFRSANEALGGVAPADRTSAEYFKGAAALAWALKEYPEAESNYLEAVRLEPTNLVSQLNLAVVQLVSTNEATANKARLALDQMKANANMRAQVLRQLMFDAARNKQKDKALAYSTELQADPHCMFADNLTHLGLLDAAKSPDFAAHLAVVQKKAETNRLGAYELVLWFYSRGKTNEGLAWIESLPAATQTNLPMPVVIAEGKATLAKWTELEEMLKSQSWKDLDYLRHAFYARALRGSGNTAVAAGEWQSALRLSAKRNEALDDLVRRAASWGWEPEVDDALWAIIDNFPADRNAFVVLYNRLFMTGNSPGLRNLLAKAYAAAPSNNDLENNLAILLLLLDPTGSKGHDLAHEVYTKDPKNPFYLSTYAYSLHLHNKGDEALKLFGTLTAQQLGDPSVAAYYGIILAASGEGAKARQYLELANGAKLLPEENKLIKKAKDSI